MNTNRKKLILHFDARNTLFVADIRYRVNIEEALNSYISGIVWGQIIDQYEENDARYNNLIQSNTCKQEMENIPGTTTKNFDPHADGGSSENMTRTLDKTKQRVPYAGENFTDLSNEELTRFKNTSARWRCLPESPCIRQPRPDAISIYKMLETQIVKTPADRGRLRKYLGDFTQTPEGLPFVHLFNQHLQMLRYPTQSTEEEATCTVQSKLAVIGKDKNRYHYLMPAFFRLLTWLLHNHYEFAILIRTYGRDGPHILAAIETYMNALHPMEKPPTDSKVNVDHSVWRLNRNDVEPNFSLHNENAQISVDSPREIYNLWSSWTGAVSIVDDFNYWQSNNYQDYAAKPFWIDPDDRQTQHIIFDDNIRFEHDGTNGIDFHRLDRTSNGSNSLDADKAVNYENVYFVQADLLNIIRNTNYFVDKVEECHTNLIRQQNANS